MYEIFTSDFRQRSFESLSEFYTYAIYDETCPECTNNDQLRPSSREEGSFYGTETFGDAVKLAINGWAEGLQELQYGVKKNKFIDAPSNKFCMYNDVTGSFVDIDKYIRGEPECMLEFECVSEPRFATIFVSGGVSGCVGHETIISRGRKILEVIDALEQNNIRTKVIQVFGTNSGDGTELITVVCKDCQNRLDVEALNFALCHPAQVRRFEFSVCERAPVEWRKKMGYFEGAGYGCPANDIKKLIKRAFPSEKEYILFNSKSGIGYTHEDIDEQVEKIITKKGA